MKLSSLPRFEADDLDKEMRNSLKNIRLYVSEPISKDVPQNRLFLTTDLTALLNPYYIGVEQLVSAQQAWDFLFAKAGELVVADYFDDITLRLQRPRQGAIKELAKSFHWSFGQDGQGRITELFVPFGSTNKEIQTLSELRTLSFDMNWIAKTERAINSSRYEVTVDFSKLKKLERLYLAHGTPVTSSSNRFLARLVQLPNLEHLQSPCVDELQLPITGFGNLKQLKSLTWFGIPTQIQVDEIASLPNLQRLVIVDQDNMQPTDKWLAAVQETLPQIEVTLVDLDHWQPDMPESFRLHLKTTKKILRPKLLEELE